MDAKEFIRNYWLYYIELEKQVWATQRFVAFDTRNNATFSMEYIELLQVICSEIDVVGKAIATHFNANVTFDSNSNIYKWGYEVQNALTGLDKIKVVFYSEYELAPWKKWKYVLNEKRRVVLDKSINAETPFWWTSYNKVKHHRTSAGKGGNPNFMRANLKAVSNALAALYILEWQMLNTCFAASIADVETSRLFRII